MKRSGSLASIKYLSSQFYRFLAHLLSHSFLFFFFIVCTSLPHLGRLVIESHRHKLVIPINQSDLVTRRQPKNLVTGISKQNFSPFKYHDCLNNFDCAPNLRCFSFSSSLDVDSFDLEFFLALEEPKLVRNIPNAALEQRGKQSRELETENLCLTESWHDYIQHIKAVMVKPKQGSYTRSPRVDKPKGALPQLQSDREIIQIYKS